APLLVAVERDRFLQNRVRLGFTESLHLDGGGRLRPNGLVPDGKALQARETLFVELRPDDVPGLERSVGLDERPAKEPAVLIRSDPDGLHDGFRPPWPSRRQDIPAGA